MPNIYKRKYPDRVLDEEALRQLLKDIQSKIETPTSAARKYNINRTTIIYRLKLLSENRVPIELQSKTSSKYSVGQIFTTSEEGELTEYFKKCSNLHYGLTFDMAKRFVYDYAIKNKKKCPSSWDKEQAAGKVWLLGFMRRNPSISLRKPENISLARLRAFTKTAVTDFFCKLKGLLLKHSFKPENIYNLDETGLTTVMDSIRIIAQKGKRTVSQTASGERGTLVTMVAIVNAAGNHTPPVYVCPRKKSNPLFMKGAAPGAIGLFSDSGWMTSEMHLKVLEHLKHFSKCSKEDPILLLLDNHASHCSLDAILYCRDNGIILLSFPPHTSHRLQPLDVAVFGPFKRQCKSSFNNYLVNNPDIPTGITIYDIPALSSQPFLRAFSPENITKGFLSTGISPFNSDIFEDSEFCQPEGFEETMESTAASSIVPSTPIVSINNFATAVLPISEANEDESACIVSAYQAPSPSTLISEQLHTTPEAIRPFPKLGKKKHTGRPAGKSRIYTDTPEKNRLEELAAKKSLRMKKLSIPKAKKHKVVKRVLHDSSSEDCDKYSLRDSDTSLQRQCSDNEEIEEIKFSKHVAANPGDFVLIRISDRKELFYVGLVAAVEENSDLPYTIKYLRRQSKSNIFYEPIVEDVKLAMSVDLVAKLPKPEQMPGTSRSKEKIRFNVSFADLDIR